MPTSRRHFLRAAGCWTAASITGPGTATVWSHSPPRKLRVGQIGVGHAHATKLSVYRASDDYEVLGIVESDPQRRLQAQEIPAFRDLPWMTAEQLLNQANLDVVLVETEVKDLLDTAEACVAAGKHIHLDKPAGESLSQFRRLMKAAEQKGLMVQLGYMYRYNPAVVLLRSLVERGLLGEVFEVHTVMSKVVSDENRKMLAEYSGGIMFELGCHVLDTVIKLMGAPTRVTNFHQRSRPEHDLLVDNMLSVLEYPQATASIRSSALEVEGFARRHLTVCGTEGTFHIQPLDNPTARLALDKPRAGYEAGYQELRFPRYERYVDDARDMARVIRGEKVNDFAYSHDLLVQTTLLDMCAVS
jgi:predicted dehydrogenase